MTDSPRAVRIDPLEPGDPPILGAARLTGRLDSTDAGVVYAGEQDGEPVVAVLLSAGAETDSFGRARFERSVRDVAAVNPEAVLAFEFGAEVAPWAVLAAGSWDEAQTAARALLAPVTVEHLAPVGKPRGPEFRAHWFERSGRGSWRIWPLPWPSALHTAGRWTYVAAFALIVAISAIALWIAIQVFQTQPPAPRPGPGPVPGPLPPPPSVSPSPQQSPQPSPSPSNGLPTASTAPSEV